MNEKKTKELLGTYAVVGTIGGVLGGPFGAILLLALVGVVHLWTDHFSDTARFLGRALKWGVLIFCFPVTLPAWVGWKCWGIVNAKAKSNAAQKQFEARERQRIASLPKPKTPKDLEDEALARYEAKVGLARRIRDPDAQGIMIDDADRELRAALQDIYG